ncbi:hypothetical protein GGF32_008570 [Allomyces javanicus]|nr:hypothetical protein GGF32_008570 [Allomyces javanicus]
MFARNQSQFYAAILVLIVMQLYDLACFVFGLRGDADSPAQLVLADFDYLACAMFTVLFASMNLVRYDAGVHPHPQAWAGGYLFDSVLNVILPTLFIVHLRVMARDNAFRAGLQHYVTKAEALLVLELIALVSVLALQRIDSAADPLWLTWYLAQV